MASRISQRERVREIARGVFYLARGTKLAVQAGYLFPKGSRLPTAEAPGGSTERRLDRPGRLRETDAFTHTFHRLPVPGLTRPVRILHLSDIHLRRLTPWVERLAAHLSGFRPDLLVLTGDVVTRHWTRECVDHLLGALPPAPLGRFASMGNWEHMGGADPTIWRPVLADHGVELMINRWTDLGPLALSATDDLMRGRPDVDASLDDIPAGHPTVVLSHSPALFPKLVRPGVRLVLSGHAHGGQIRLPRAGSFFVPTGCDDYIAGWYREGDSHLFVSRGLGWSLAPVRLNCPPEIAEIELLPA
jgi:hypothetical protein